MKQIIKVSYLGYFAAIILCISYFGFKNINTIYCGIICILSTIYSLEPIRLKKYPILSSLCIIISRPLIYHWLLIRNQSQTNITFELFYNLIIIMFAVCLYKDVPDIEGDINNNIITTASILGLYGSNIITIIIMIFLLYSSFGSFCLLGNNIRNFILLITSSLIIKFTKESFTNKIPEAYQTIWKFFYTILITYLFLHHKVPISKQYLNGSIYVKSFVNIMKNFDNFIKNNILKLTIFIFSIWFLVFLGIEKKYNNFNLITKITTFIAKNINLNGKRKYINNKTISDSYDKWTDDNILENLWGDDIHLGYYPNELLDGTSLKSFYDFKLAKKDMINFIFNWALNKSNTTKKIFNNMLDAGCGLGGSSRYIFNNFSVKNITGISLSEKQIRKAIQLTKNDKIKFKKMNILETNFSDNTFDLIWSLEMEPHIENKEQMLNEFLRLLKPGGLIILGCWNSTEKKLKDNFLLEEWAHPNFWSISKYENYLKKNKSTEFFYSNNITKNSLPSWEESIKEGFRNPSVLLSQPSKIMTCLREIVPITKMADAFNDGYLEYGIFVIKKN